MANKLFEANVSGSVKSITEVEGGLKIRGYANTVTKDRVGDVIPKEAWLEKSALENYNKNPIILAFHDHSQPIGRMTSYEVTDKGLEIEAFISSADARIHQLVKEGVLSTFSVGFAIKDAEYIKATDTYLIKSVELHEVSVVSVPCNQDSTFSVAKSMNGASFKAFEGVYHVKAETIEEQPQPEESMLDILAKAFPQFIKEPSGQ